MATAEKQEKKVIIKEIEVSIISSQGIMYQGMAEFIEAPGKSGILGIAPDHAKLVSLLRKGDVLIKKGMEEKTFPINDGVLQVTSQNKITILCNIL